MRRIVKAVSFELLYRALIPLKYVLESESIKPKTMINACSLDIC